MPKSKGGHASSGRGDARRRTTRALAATIGVGVVGLNLLAGIQATQAAPDSGSPAFGVPEQASLYFEETFEDGTTNRAELSTFTGASGMQYTASPYWLDVNQCNGIILAGVTPQQVGDCYSPTDNSWQGAAEWRSVLTKSVALGLLNGMTATSQHPSTGTAWSNRALSTNTTALRSAIEAATDHSHVPIPDAANNQIMIASKTALEPAHGSLYGLLSVDYAAAWCDEAKNPLLRLQWMSGTEIQAESAVIDPCAAPGVRTDFIYHPMVPGIGESAPIPQGTFPIRSAHVYSTQASLLTDTGHGLSFRILNLQDTSSGNDGAIDNLRVWDVTPRLSKSFDPPVVNLGQKSTLTLRVANTYNPDGTTLVAKEGWALTDSLPEGMRLASPANMGSPSAASCGADVQLTSGVGPDGRTWVRVANGSLADGQAHCDVTVDVVSDVLASSDAPLLNCAANISDTTGVKPPANGCASLTVTSAPYTLHKSSDPADGSTVRPGSTVTYSVQATGSGPGTSKAVSIVDDLAGVLDHGTLIAGSAYATGPDGSPIDVTLAGAKMTTAPVDLMLGQSVTLTYKVRIDPAAVGVTVRNVATGVDIDDGPPTNCAVAPDDCDTTHVTGRLQIFVEKRDPAGTMLDGASWEVVPDDNGSPGSAVAGLDVTPVAGERGLYVIDELLPGTYWLTETTAPVGFNLLAEPIVFTLDAHGRVTLDDELGGFAVVEVDDESFAHLVVTDVPQFVLPNTGASGLVVPYAAGVVLLLGTAGGLVLSRRRGRVCN